MVRSSGILHKVVACPDVKLAVVSVGDAAPGEVAQPLWESLCDALEAKRGVFGAMMEVELVNNGPVTLTLEELPEAS